MKINGKAYRTIWLAADGWSVEIIDQTRLPHALVVVPLRSMRGGARARSSHAGARRAADRRHRRLRHRAGDARGCLRRSARSGASTSSPRSGRPRSICAGRWSRCGAARAATCRATSASRRPTGARPRSATRTSRPAAASASTGSRSSATSPRGRTPGEPRQHAHPLQRRLARRASTGARRPRPSTWRTTPASPLHVWVDETRPRNQGASLTAFELGAHGVPHTIIVDNAGGHLMQRGRGRSRASSAPTASPRTATSPTRSAPI